MNMHWLKYVLIALPVFILVIYLGLPKLLTSLGLHPHYDIPGYNLPSKRALIITTSHDTLGETGKATGVFGSEMSVPYYAFEDSGMAVDIASIKGGEIPVEPNSMGWPLATEDDLRFKEDSFAMAKLKNSIAIKDIDPTKYDVIFLSGGWGAAYDFVQSEELAKLVTAANQKDALIGAICHGVLGLINAKDKDGSSLIKGRKVTGVTDLQIKQLGIEDITPKHPETELRKAGGIYEASTAFRDMMATHVVVDGNIITGQNQNSGYETAHRILERLAQYKQ